MLSRPTEFNLTFHCLTLHHQSSTQTQPSTRARDCVPILQVCNKWLAGACPFGDKCHFAHGHQEVRQRAPLPGGDVPGAGTGDWQQTLAELRSGRTNLPTAFAPPPSALVSVAAAAAAGDFAYAGNPFGDYVAELVEPEAAAEAAAEAAEAAEAAATAAGMAGVAAGVDE